MEMRSTSSASQATVLRKKSWFPWKPRRELLAKSASPTTTTRPSGAFGASPSAPGDGAGEGDGVGAGEGPRIVATAAREMGPRRAFFSSKTTRPLGVRAAPAQDPG